MVLNRTEYEQYLWSADSSTQSFKILNKWERQTVYCNNGTEYRRQLIIQTYL